jgi:hypothetical protein
MVRKLSNIARANPIAGPSCAALNSHDQRVHDAAASQNTNIINKAIFHF